MSQYCDTEWQTMLNLLAWRDAPVELSRDDARLEGPPIDYRSRLLGLEPDGSIIVERPPQVVRDRVFSDGDDIELLLMHNNERMIATCTIKDTFIRQLNKSVRVTCYRLSPGRRPQRQQRRAFFRVGVAAMDLEPVVLRHESDNDCFECRCRLVNISGGGLGVSIRAKKDTLGKLKRRRTLHCTADFGDGYTLSAPVRVTHLNALGDDGLYLGLRFDLEDEAEARAVEDQMVHLCAEFQRLQLQRRRA